jgi:cell division protein FtsL
MSMIAPAARAPRARPRGRADARGAGERRTRVLAGGVLWILLFASLLAGVVAVNVTVLRHNVLLDEAGRERAQLEADIAGLRSELSRTSSSARIERLARKELGLVLAEPDDVVYVSLPR